MGQRHGRRPAARQRRRARRRQGAGEDRPGLEAGERRGATVRRGRYGRGRRRRSSVRRWARAERRADAAAAAGRPGARARRVRPPAWRHTFTKRCTAVTAVSTSITHRIGIEQRVEQQAEAQQDDPLGPLHEAALGVEAERLGLGPLVGDEQRRRPARQRAAATAWPPAACWPGTRPTPPSSSESETRSATESKKAPRGLAVPDALATAPSSSVGQAGEDEEEEADRAGRPCRWRPRRRPP